MENYKHEEFYVRFDFKNLNWVFSSDKEEREKVWLINGKHNSLLRALEIVYRDIDETIDMFWTKLHETEKNFYIKEFPEKVKNKY